MNIKIDIEYISEYGKEICLQNLLQINKVLENLKEKGDLSGVEKLEKEVIPIYEKIYFSLDIEELKKINEETSLKTIEENLEKILKVSNLSRESILEQLNLRKRLRGKSGAEVIRKFHSYKLKEYKKIKYSLIDKINKNLDEEEKLNLELSNSIQEKEQMKIIEGLQPVRTKFRNLEKQLNVYENEIKVCEDVLNKKWKYEIYGTREEKEFLDVFMKTYEK